VKDGRVYHGTGNSTYAERIQSKRPGVICRDATTGEEIWYRQLPDNVLGQPVADRYQLFVGCVDGNAYALDLRTGAVNWKLPIDSAIYATPVVDVNKESDIADVVYFAGKEGAITAVSPYSSSRIFWSINLSYWTQSTIDQTATPTLLRVEDDKTIRRRLFCGFCQGQLGSGAARLFCIEDVAKKQADVRP
jgi:outer membrane protein assembly factor BamB